MNAKQNAAIEQVCGKEITKEGESQDKTLCQAVPVVGIHRRAPPHAKVGKQEKKNGSQGGGACYGHHVSLFCKPPCCKTMRQNACVNPKHSLGKKYKSFGVRGVEGVI